MVSSTIAHSSETILHTVLRQQVTPGLSFDGGLDATDLGAFCAARLSRYKIPEIWGQAASLPVNAMGKIIRTDLAAVLSSSARL